MPDERRYSDREVAEIVRLATEGKVAPANQGMTLAEIQAVVGELGLDASSVADAAGRVEAGLPESTERGGQFEFMRTFEGELDDDSWEELVLLLRRRTGWTGEVTVRGATREWGASQSDIGAFHFSATRKNGRTRVRMTRSITGALILTWLFGSVAFMLLPLIIVVRSMKSGLDMTIPFIVAGLITAAIIFIGTSMVAKSKRRSRELESILDEIEPFFKQTDKAQHEARQEVEDSPRLRLGQTE